MWSVVRRGSGKYHNGALPQARNARPQPTKSSMQNSRRNQRGQTSGERKCIRTRSGSAGLQRDFTREEVKKCVANLKNRKEARRVRRKRELIYDVRGRRNAYHDDYVV